MSSYRGGPWDGGPPGAEAEYVGQPPPPAYPPPPGPLAAGAPALPATDPWTGVSYSQYGHPPNYDYQAYSSGYGYSYDSSYYRQDGNYYKYPDTSSAYPPPPSGYDYSSSEKPREATRSPVDSRSYDRRRRSYSRSASPYERYSSRGRCRSRSPKLKRKYSSSDRSSSRSRSYSRSRKNRKRLSVSSNSSGSVKSYKKTSKSGGHSKSRVQNSLTPPLRKKRSISRSHRTPSPRRSISRSPISRLHRTPSPRRSISKPPKPRSDKGTLKIKEPKSHSSKDKRQREVATPPNSPKKSCPKERSLTPPKSYKIKGRSVTPPKSYKSSTSRKHRDSSLTPPKSYARSRSSSSSRSRSRSPSPPRHTKRKRSLTPKSHHSSRSSSRSSGTPRHSSSRRTKRKSASKQRSRSTSRTKHRSVSKGRSKRRSTSKSKGKKKSESRSKSRSKSRSPRSHSGTPSEDEQRRGQFTVADRKRFWKLHKSRQEEREKDKTPPIEVKPPPGAVEKTHVDDIQYGEPPEIEGPNFDELLPSHDSVMKVAGTSKQRNVPLPIKNDGSFLEMFKKLQEETKKIEEIEKKPEIKKPLPFIGKRRGGRVLKTGIVKKAKAIDEQNADNTPKDAWSLYMQEVKKYRETSCEEERKTRPLVK